MQDSGIPGTPPLVRSRTIAPPTRTHPLPSARGCARGARTDQRPSGAENTSAKERSALRLRDKTPACPNAGQNRAREQADKRKEQIHGWVDGRTDGRMDGTGGGASVRSAGAGSLAVWPGTDMAALSMPFGDCPSTTLRSAPPRRLERPRISPCARSPSRSAIPSIASRDAYLQWATGGVWLVCRAQIASQLCVRVQIIPFIAPVSEPASSSSPSGRSATPASASSYRPTRRLHGLT